MEANIKELQETAKKLRKNLLAMIHKAKSGHPGGSLSASDIVTALYFHEMKIDPKNPKWKERDRFVLSKGHCCPVIYTALAMKGYYDMEELNHLRQIGHMLQGHPFMGKTPGIDMTTGSLGQGLSAGVGMAIAAKRDKLPSRVFVLMGDGETQEGQIWEAAETAAKYQLDNLIGIVDKNRIQNDDFVEKVMPVDDLAAKWRAFNWEVLNMDGHCMRDVVATLHKAREYRCKGKPVVILANTTKGRYVSFMENVPAWHGMAPNDEQFAQACSEIDACACEG